MKTPLEWTAPELAKMFGVTRNCVTRWIDIGLVPTNGKHGKAFRCDLRAALAVGLLSSWSRKGYPLNSFSTLAAFLRTTSADEILADIGAGRTVLVGPGDGKNPARLVEPSIGAIQVCIGNDRPDGVEVKVVAVDLAACLSLIFNRIDADLAREVLRETDRQEAAHA